MAYGYFQDLNKRTAFDKVLHDKACNIAKNPEYEGCQRGLDSIANTCFDKKLATLASRSAAATDTRI